jgi:hypothetical protein
MKNILLIVVLINITFSVKSQKIKSVEEFDLPSITKKEWRKYKNGFDVQKLETDYGTFKVGNELLINQPSNPDNINNKVYNGVKVGNSSAEFSFVSIGRFSIMQSLLTAVKMDRSNSNTEIIIQRIRAYKPAMGQPVNIVADFTRKDGANTSLGKFGNIIALERAISLGEILNPNAPLNRQQAIAKLKEAKDLLELEMMNQEEYDNLRKELTPIIKGN